MSDQSSRPLPPERAPLGTPQGLLSRYQQAMIDQDADAFADLYASDAVHELPFLFPGMPARYEGRDAIRAAYGAAWSASDARPNAVRVVATHRTDDPEVIIAEQVVTGTNASTGEPFRLPGVLVVRVRGGEIAHVRDYMDGLAVAQAMRRLPAVVEALGARPHGE